MNKTFCLQIIALCLKCAFASFGCGTTKPEDSVSTVSTISPSILYCDGDDWVSYKNEKCFKLIKAFSVRDQAELICNKEDSQSNNVVSTLAVIKSKAEQEYLTKYVFETNKADTGVWIGLRRLSENSTQFVWNDNSVISGLDFVNWAKDNPTNETKRNCVEMQSELSRQISTRPVLDKQLENGKWKDVSCNKGNWVLCQKFPTWSLQLFQKYFLEFKQEQKDLFKLVSHKLNNTVKELSHTKNELDAAKLDLINTKNHLASTINELDTTKNNLANTNNNLDATKNALQTTNHNLEVLEKNPIPIGFIYVQLPGQLEPWHLWGSVGWSEITSDYAGLFFRVLGGGSEQFGHEQLENAPRLYEAMTIHLGKWPNIQPYTHHVGIAANWEWSQLPLYSGAENSEFWAMQFKVSGGEVRPRNKAIRIFKRIH